MNIHKTLLPFPVRYNLFGILFVYFNKLTFVNCEIPRNIKSYITKIKPFCKNLKPMADFA